MIIIVFNIVGMVMALAAIFFGMGLGCITGTKGDAIFVVIGSLTVLFDVTYRVQQPSGHWMSPSGGGNIMFVPVWVIGVFWLATAIYLMWTLPSTIEPLAAAIAGLVGVASLALVVWQLARCRRAAFWKIGEEEPNSDNQGTPRTGRDASERRCPSCNLPAKSEEFEDGKCPWCGINVD